MLDIPEEDAESNHDDNDVGNETESKPPAVVEETKNEASSEVADPPGQADETAPGQEVAEAKSRPNSASSQK